jgi:hypothetical protein
VYFVEHDIIQQTIKLVQQYEYDNIALITQMLYKTVQMHLLIHIIHEVDDEVIVALGVVIIDIQKVEIVVYQVIVEHYHGIDTQ